MMRPILILFLFLLNTLNLQSQETIVARIVDADTGDPIAFANVGIVGKSLGTVSDENGYFQLGISGRIQEKDFFRVSILGYGSRSFMIEDFMTINGSDILLKVEPFDLDTTTVTELVKERRTLGYQKITDNHLGYWKGGSGLGGEIATRIRIRKKRTKLLKIKSHVFVVNADSVLTRINIYNYKNRYPQENVSNNVIYKTITEKDTKISVNLSPYNIIVDDDVVVSIELVKVYGDSIQAGIYGSTQNAISFTRAVSQDKWKRHDGKGVAIALEVGQIKKELYTLSKEREKAKHIQIFWDGSRSLKNRNFDKEFEFLENYLLDRGNASVDIAIFDNQIRNFEHYERADVIDLEILKATLENTRYDGMADYRHLNVPGTEDLGNTLIFTDGNSFLGSLQQSYQYPVFTISSTVDANREALQDIALFNDGHYVNLAKTSVEEGVKNLSYDLEDLEVYTSQKDKTAWIEGMVYLDSVPVQGALVSIEGTYVEEQTDARGSFKIPAQIGDILKVNFFGSVPEEIEVKSDTLQKIYLETLGNKLEEVVIKGNKKKQRTRTRNNVRNAVFEITAADIDSNETQLKNILRRNTAVLFDQDGRALLPRAYSAIGIPKEIKRLPPNFLIDGVIYAQTEQPYIDPAEISSISIVNQRTSQNYYNQKAGLIIIRTKTFQESLEKRRDIEKEGGDIIADISIPYEVSYSNNSTIQQIAQASSLEQALAIYNENIHQTRNVPYYIEAGELFVKWDIDAAAAIMSNALTLAPKNTRVLKIIASYYEQFKKLKQAENIYAQIARLLPNNRLALRDLAMIAEVNGNYQEAYYGYKKLATSREGRKDLTTLAPIVKNEFNRLITLHQDIILEFDQNQYFKNPSEGLDLRLVLSWMPSNLDVELQFISPNNKKFKWKLLDRTMLSGNAQEAIEEFVLPDAPEGEWLINLKYNGEDESFQLPPYLKLSIYKNFATAFENKEVQTLKLFNQSRYTTVGRIIL